MKRLHTHAFDRATTGIGECRGCCTISEVTLFWDDFDKIAKSDYYLRDVRLPVHPFARNNFASIGWVFGKFGV